VHKNTAVYRVCSLILKGRSPMDYYTRTCTVYILVKKIQTKNNNNNNRTTLAINKHHILQLKNMPAMLSISCFM